MYASVQFNATLSCSCQSWESIPMQFKNPVSSLGNFHTKGRKERRLGTQRLHFCSGAQLVPRLTTSRLTCKAANTTQDKKVKFSRDELTESQLEKWQKASGVLEGLGFDTEEADKMLGKAFGWVHSPYWTEKPEQIVPDLETVSSKVDFVKAIGYSDDEVKPVLKKFPELLGCRETLMKHNLGVLDKEWGIAGKTLKGLLKRNPHALGYNVDCRGDCMAQCTRCWVRF